MRNYTETGLERLEAAIARQAVADHYGIGDSAFAVLALKMDRLRYATRRELGVSGGGEQDGYGKVSGVGDEGRPIPSLRTSARTVAAVFSPDGEDPALWMHQAIGNSGLTVEHWVEVLRSTAGQPTVEELRHATRLLRKGFTTPETAARAGLAEKQVERLSALVGVAEWRVDREVRYATDCFEQGMPVRESWERWHELAPVPHRSLKTWRRRYEQAAEVLGADSGAVDA